MNDRWNKNEKMEFVYDYWELSFMGHSLSCSVEKEVLETLPLCQWFSEIDSCGFDASSEVLFISDALFLVTVLEDFEEAVVSIDFDIVESFWDLHDSYNLQIKKNIYHL